MAGSIQFTGASWKSYMLVLGAVFLLSGCQAVFVTSRGHVVPPRDRIALVAQGQQSGSWRTRSVRIRYRYVRTSNQLRISGHLQFGDYLQKVYPYIVYCHSGVLLLNDHGRVLAAKNLTTSRPYAPSTEVVPFRVTYDLPPGTTAFAFSYTGRAREIAANQGGGVTSFYHYP